MKNDIRRFQRRLDRYLYSNQLLLVKVAGYASQDRCISSTVELLSGATVGNPEYNAILRDLVKCVIGE